MTMRRSIWFGVLVSLLTVAPVGAQGYPPGVTPPVFIQTGPNGSGPRSVYRNGITTGTYTTASDALALANVTAGTVGTKLQDSPGFRFIAQAWHTVDAVNYQHEMSMALVPASVDYTAGPPGFAGRPADTLKWYSFVPVNDASPTEIMRLQGNGNLLAASSVDAGMGYSFTGTDDNQAGDVSAAPTSGIYWRAKASTDGAASSRVTMGSTGPGIFQLYDTGAGAMDIEINVGTLARPTISSLCGTNPSISSKSTNAVGEVNIGTGGTAKQCIVAFASPAWSNVPICTANVQTATDTAVRALGTAASTTLLELTSASLESGVARPFASGSIISWNCFSTK